MERFALTLSLMSWDGSEKISSETDQYALILFWRKLYSDAACCLISTVNADQLGSKLVDNTMCKSRMGGALALKRAGVVSTFQRPN